MGSQVRKERRMIRCDKSKKELIKEAMRDSEDYFKELERQLGKTYANMARKAHRKQLEEELKDYKQGQEVEIEIVVVD